MIIDGRTLRWGSDASGISLETCLVYVSRPGPLLEGKHAFACQIILVSCCKVLPKSFCSSLPLDNLIQQLAPSASSMLSPTSRLETLTSAKETKWHRLSWKCCYCLSLILYAIVCQCSFQSGKHLHPSLYKEAHKQSIKHNKGRVPISRT